MEAKTTGFFEKDDLMIAFDLQCRKGHVFEGWFESGDAFEKQRKKGLVTCPVCNDASVDKIPTSFGILKSSSAVKPLTNDEQQRALIDIGKKIVDFVEKNFDDVGADFTKEALKMHYGVTEPRNIRGVSSQEEEKVLAEEGIAFFKVPMPVEKEDQES